MIETISPFPIEELPRVFLWLREAGSSLFNDQGPQTMDEFVDQWLVRIDSALTWGVWRDGELGGWIVYEPLNESTGNTHCVFRKGGKRAKGFWGRDVTRPALSQVAEDLWAIGVERIGMPVMADNQAIQALILWLGGEKEGEARKLYLPDGRLLTRDNEPIGMVQYGLYKDAWQARQSAPVVDPPHALAS